MARGDIRRPGPGQNIKDYTVEQLYDRADDQVGCGQRNAAAQKYGELDERTDLWHSLID